MLLWGLAGTTVAPAAAATCQNSVGPGLPPPASVAAGIPGFHAAWYGQSGYPTLCPGTLSIATVAYYNSGSLGWVQGVMGQVAYLGTWNSDPGQDMPSKLGGDGTNGSPNTGWPRYNRIAAQPASYVGPGQVAWFQFTVQAPTTPGTYYLYLRPLIEGAQWMEDYGVYWVVTVQNPTTVTTPTPSPSSTPTPTLPASVLAPGVTMTAGNAYVTSNEEALPVFVKNTSSSDFLLRLDTSAIAVTDDAGNLYSGTYFDNSVCTWLGAVSQGCYSSMHGDVQYDVPAGATLQLSYLLESPVAAAAHSLSVRFGTVSGAAGPAFTYAL